MSTNHPTSHTFTSPTRPSRHFSYLQTGPPSAPLLIFIHGWPAVALTWLPQLHAFTSLGFRCAAMDTLGYGHSAAPHDDAEYSCEELVRDQLEFLRELNAPKALWVAHDWGCGVLWTLAAHFPEVVVGAVGLSVPYRQLEMGLERLLGTINREIYPVEECEFGPWDYQVYYQRYKHDGATKQLDSNLERSVKLIYMKGRREVVGQRSRTSGLTKEGGWFGGKTGEEIMDIPLGMTVFEGLNGEVFQEVVGGLERNGFHGATSYYLNHERNERYNRDENVKANGRLEMPVLFVDSVFDAVCTESGAKGLCDPMRELCKDLREVEVESGHWVAMEKPQEVNAAIAKWLVERVEGWWPKQQVRGKL